MANIDSGRYYRKKTAYARCPWGATKSYEYQRAGRLPEFIAVSDRLKIVDAEKWDSAVEEIVAEARSQPGRDVVADARAARAEKRKRGATAHAGTPARSTSVLVDPTKRAAA